MKTMLSTLLLAGLMGLPAMAAVSGRANAACESVNGDIVFEFPVAELGRVTMQDQDWTTISMEGCNTSTVPGEPEVPLIGRFVQIPDQSDVRFVLVEAEYEDFDLNAPLLPQLERVHSEAELPLPFLFNEAAYHSSQYPAEVWECDDPVLLRNNRLVKLVVHPAQIREEGATLRIYSRLVLRPVFEGVNPINQRTRRIQSSGTSLVRAVEQQIVNRDVSHDGAMRDLFDARVLPGNYLFIAYDETITGDAVFNTFVDWKRSKGHHVDIATSSEIGSMTNSSIKSYIQNAYFNWEYTPEFVVLFGDAESYASEFSIPAGPGGSYDGQQDHYYACVDGTDALADIVVGRISIENINQMRTVLRKTMYYEQTPTGNGIGDAWMSHAALSVGYDAFSMIQQSRSIAIDLVEHGYDVIDTTWSSSLEWVNARFNEGISIYNYRGWVGMNGVDASSVDNDSYFNNSYRTPVTVIFTCGTGNFNQSYSTTEAFLRKGDVVDFKGGVCAMGFCTSDTHTAYNNAVVGGFFYGALDFNIPQVGTDMFMGKYHLYLALAPGDSNAEVFANRANLMGDPGMDIWLGRPDVLSVDCASGISLGSEYFDVGVEAQGGALADAVVCLYDADTGFQVRCITDASGRAVLPLDGLSAGDVTLTVSKPQFLVVQQELSVTQAQSAVAVTASGIQGDGIALPGETVALRPVLENIGSLSTLTSVSGAITVDPAWGVATTSTANWANLVPGASAASSTSFVIQLTDELFSGQELMIPLHITSAQGSFDTIIPVCVTAPVMLLTDIEFVPGGGAMLSGVACQADLTLANTGDYDASGLSFTLVDADYFVDVLQGTSSLSELAVGASGSVSFELFAEEAYAGYTAEMQLNWSTSEGICGSLPVQFTLGYESSESPTGPDRYGYRIYEDTDANTESPHYDWIEIAPSAGGSGTLVPLTDNGDEQDDAVLMNLPFDFVFYGESFDQVGICSNGFIAFGPLAHMETDFRNHNLPCGMGPDYMLAPMWDDFYMDAEGQVYTKYLPAEGMFVVEWYNTRFNGYSSDRNTFQIILYDPVTHPTLTGDGEIVFQYSVFNNTQSNSTDYPSCTIGMKNGDSTDGLMLTHVSQWVSTATPISDGRAVKITTDIGYFTGIDLVAPVIEQQPLDVAYNSAPLVISASITDATGVLSAELFYSVDGGEYETLTMGWQGGSMYSAQLPRLGGGSVLEYHIVAVDASDEHNERVTTTRTIQVYYNLGQYEMGGIDGWTHTDGPGRTDEWHLESARYHSAGTSWKFGGSGLDDYGSSSGGVLTSPVINIPSGATDLQLSFWSWINAETSSYYPDSCYDGGVVEVSLNGGEWEPVTPTSGYSKFLRERSALSDWFGFPRPMFAGAEEWTPYIFPLGDTVAALQVRFMFGSDGAVQHEGWYIDDLRITSLGEIAAPDPVMLSINVLPNGQIELDWDESEFAVVYHVYASSNAYSGYELIATTEEPGYTISHGSGWSFFMVKALN